MEMYGMTSEQFEEQREHMLHCLEATKKMIMHRFNNKVDNSEVMLGDIIEQEKSVALIETMKEEIEAIKS